MQQARPLTLLLLLLEALCVVQICARTVADATTSSPSEEAPTTERYDAVDDEGRLVANQENYQSELEEFHGGPVDEPPTGAQWDPDDRVNIGLSRSSGSGFHDFSAPAYKIIEYHDDEKNNRHGPKFDPFNISEDENYRDSLEKEEMLELALPLPTHSLQQQLLNIAAEHDPMKNTVGPEPSEEYFWDSEGDADYLRFDDAEKFLHPSQEIIRDSIAPRPPQNKAVLPAVPQLMRPPTAHHLNAGSLNLIITKGPSQLDKAEQLRLLQNSQVVAEQLGPRLTPAAELNVLLTSAVDAVISNGEQTMRKALQKVMEPNDDFATTAANNFFKGNKSDVQLALDTILNSNIVYKKEEVGNSSSVSLGYVPLSKGSSIDLNLNRFSTEEQGSQADAQTSKVNIFIINIIRNSNSTIQDGKRFDAQDKVSLEEIFGENLSSNGSPSNSHGLTLNHNTILKLLPDFVKATTVSPLVPLFNTPLHESLEVKPSVLGLLPNDVFTLKKELHVVPEEMADDWEAESEEQVSDLIDHQSTEEEKLFIYHPLPANNDKSDSDMSRYQIFPNDYSLEKDNQFPGKKSNVFISEKVQPAVGSARMPAVRDNETTLRQSSDEYRSSAELPSLLSFLPVLDGEDLDSDLSNLKQGSITNNKSVITADKSVGEKKKETSYLGNVQSVVKALAIGALPSGVAVASAFWPVWAPAVFGRRRKKRSSASMKAKSDWFSILNGSRYNSRSRFDDFNSRRMSNSTVDDSKTPVMKTSDLAALIQSAAPSTMKIAENTYTSVNPSVFLEKRTTKSSYSEFHKPKTSDSSNKSTTIASNLNTNDNMDFSIGKLHSMLFESTTRGSIFMTTPHFGDGKSPTEDVQLVSNFLTSALSGWSSKNDTAKETPKNNYIQINVSSTGLNDTVSGTHGSPIVLVDKETGEIKPISNVSKNDTDLLNKIEGDLNERLDLLRNRSETSTSSTTPSTTQAPTVTTLPPVRSVATTARTTRATTPTTTTTATTTTPAPSGVSSVFSMLASAIQNPPPEVASAMSFVGTITVYGAAALMPLWLPLVVGKKRKKRTASRGSKLEYSEAERVVKEGLFELLDKFERKFS